MKIEKRTTMEITELPGGMYIKASDGEIRLFDLGGSLVADALTPEKAAELGRALVAAAGDEGGPWERIEDVPLHVQRVIDEGGDPWTRRPTDQPGRFDGEAFAYLNRYAPFIRG